MSNENTKIIIVSSPSGAGKTTLCRKLASEFPDLFKISVSCTTRKPRGQEINGKDYFFISKEEFEGKIKKNEFAEWAQVHDSYYGTSKKFIEETRNNGKSVILVIDVQGATAIYNNYPHDTFRVFIAPPDMEVLEERLRKRNTEGEDTIRIRIQNAQKEIEESKRYDCIVINDDLDGSYEKFKNIILEQVSEKK